MAKTPAMVFTVNADTKHRQVAVVVEHEDWQSFSRAVIPHGKRAFKDWVRKNIVFGDLVFTGAMLGGPDVRDQPHRCISVLRFTY